MKIKNHLIAAIILNLGMGTYMWFIAVDSVRKSNVHFYNPNSISGFLGFLTSPLILGIGIPFLISLIFLVFSKKVFSKSFVILMYLMIAYQLIGAIGAS
jgi:hypothetical protein